MIAKIIIVLTILSYSDCESEQSDDQSFRFIEFNTTNYDLTSALTGVYDNIVKEYVEDIYRDTIEIYVISTVKVRYMWKIYTSDICVSWLAGSYLVYSWLWRGPSYRQWQKEDNIIAYLSQDHTTVWISTLLFYRLHSHALLGYFVNIDIDRI